MRDLQRNVRGPVHSPVISDWEWIWLACRRFGICRPLNNLLYGSCEPVPPRHGQLNILSCPPEHLEEHTKPQSKANWPKLLSQFIRSIMIVQSTTAVHNTTAVQTRLAFSNTHPLPPVRGDVQCSTRFAVMSRCLFLLCPSITTGKGLSFSLSAANQCANTKTRYKYLFTSPFLLLPDSRYGWLAACNNHLQQSQLVLFLFTMTVNADLRVFRGNKSAPPRVSIQHGSIDDDFKGERTTIQHLQRQMEYRKWNSAILRTSTDTSVVYSVALLRESD